MIEFGSVAIFALASGFIAGLLRGYSGFGFAMAAVPLLSLFIPPGVAVPAVLIHEFVIGLFSIRAERRHISWPLLTWLGAGSLLGTPLGIWLLGSVPADLMRTLVAVAVIASVALIWARRARPFALHRPVLALAGLASGILNGATAMSGPPVIVTLMGSSLSVHAVRTLLISFIVFSAAIGVFLTVVAGLQNVETVTLALAMAPGVLVGALAGVRLFHAVPSAYYRTASLAALLVIATVSLAGNLARAQEIEAAAFTVPSAHLHPIHDRNTP